MFTTSRGRAPTLSQMDTGSFDDARTGAAFATAAAFLLALLCAIVAITGVSQQAFETFAPPDAYAAGLLAGSRALRTTVFFDDLFITAYVSATLCFVRWEGRKAPSPLHGVVLGLVVSAGALGFVENHHILAMLRAAEVGEAPSSGEIVAQMTASATKWALGHAAFVLIGASLTLRGAFAKAFRFALIAVQMPVGLLVWTHGGGALGAALAWVRYTNVFVGLATLAVILHREAALPERDGDG